MLGVLPFGEDPDLSGAVGTAVPQHLPPWPTEMHFIYKKGLSIFFVNVWISCLVWEQLAAMARGEGEKVEEVEEGERVEEEEEEEGIIRFDSTGWA